jgi:hypothetical protein
MGKKLVIVDDKDDELQSRRREFGRIADVIRPSELDLSHLRDASLILLDQHLDGDHWQERSTYPLACQPMTGVAVAGVIRSHLRLETNKSRSATALAVLTARLDELVDDIDRHPREAVAARAWGLDWAFAKSSSAEGGRLRSRILEFLSAVKAFDIKCVEEPSQNLELLAKLLKVPRGRWQARAYEEIGNALPPFEGMRLFKEKTSLLRWFSQRVLPYPCFLIDEFGVAARLGVDPAWLQSRLASSKSKLAGKLRRVRYTGPLATFLGPRWWTAGVGSLIVNAAPTEGTQVSAAELAGEPIPSTNIVKQPAVRVVDKHFAPVGIANVDGCERIQPEDWPAFAESCWRKSERGKDTAGSSKGRRHG